MWETRKCDARLRHIQAHIAIDHQRQLRSDGFSPVAMNLYVLTETVVAVMWPVRKWVLASAEPEPCRQVWPDSGSIHWNLFLRHPAEQCVHWLAQQFAIQVPEPVGKWKATFPETLGGSTRKNQGNEESVLCPVAAMRVYSREVDTRQRVNGHSLAPIWNQCTPHLVPHRFDIAWISAFDKSAQMLLHYYADQLTTASDSAAIRPVCGHHFNHDLTKRCRRIAA